MERTTRAHTQSAFEHLCTATGHRIATSHRDIGAWRLDHNNVYGGYVVEEIINTGGAVTRPLGDRRMAAGEFFAACWFAIRAVESARQPVTA